MWFANYQKPKIAGFAMNPVLRCFHWNENGRFASCAGEPLGQSQRDCIIQPWVGPIPSGPFHEHKNAVVVLQQVKRFLFIVRKQVQKEQETTQGRGH